MRVLSLVLLAVAALHSLRMADANCQRNNDEVVSFTPGGVIEEELPRVPDDAKRSWPELEGKRFEEAKAVIQAEAPDVQVIKVPEGSMVTMDYRESRVRVFVKDADVVVTAPSRG